MASNGPLSVQPPAERPGDMQAILPPAAPRVATLSSPVVVSPPALVAVHNSLNMMNSYMASAAGISGEGRGYAVLANHSGKALAVKVTANAPVRAARLVTPDGYQLLKVDSRGWEMNLPAHGGAVVEFGATEFTGDAE